MHVLSTDLSNTELGMGTDEYNMLVEEASAIIRTPHAAISRQSMTGRLESIPRFLRTAHRRNPRPRQSLKPVIKSPTDPIHLQHFHRGQMCCETHRYQGPRVRLLRLQYGYGESKYIAEQLLPEAATTSAVSAVICRVGQLAGPVVNVGGVWNEQEWLPSVSPGSIPWSHLLLTYLRTQTDRMSVSAAHSHLRLPRQDPFQPSRSRHGPLDPSRPNSNNHPRPPILPLSLPLPLIHGSLRHTA